MEAGGTFTVKLNLLHSHLSLTSPIHSENVYQNNIYVNENN